MTARITVTIDDAPLRQALAGMVEAGGDLTPLMDEWGGYLEMRTDRRFETETGPGGRKWPPSIRALTEGGQTLTHSGRLRQSMTRHVTPSSVEVGTNLRYAGVHQGGATIRAKTGKALRFPLPGGGFATVASVTIPARPFVGIDDDDQVELAIIGEDYLAAAAGGLAT